MPTSERLSLDPSVHKPDRREQFCCHEVIIVAQLFTVIIDSTGLIVSVIKASDTNKWCYRKEG